eukprot:UN25844
MENNGAFHKKKRSRSRGDCKLSPAIKPYDNTGEGKSIFIIILNLMKALIGSTVLSLPYAFAMGSLIPSILALVFSLSVSLYSCMMIVEACLMNNKYELNTIFRLLRPPWNRILTNMCLIACLVNSIIVCGSYI